jgi:hypothetical protein
MKGLKIIYQVSDHQKRAGVDFKPNQSEEMNRVYTLIEDIMVVSLYAPDIGALLPI